MVYSIVHNVRGETRGAWAPGASTVAKAARRDAGAAKPGAGGNPGAAPESRRRASARVDLRRRETRELAETIVARAEWLLPPDRDLMLAVFARGLTSAQAASLLGITTRSARRRVHALATRALSKEFETVVRERGSWPPTRRRVATACVLEGRTLRQAAAHLRLTLHAVRTQMDIVRALLDEGCSR